MNIATITSLTFFDYFLLAGLLLLMVLFLLFMIFLRKTRLLRQELVKAEKKSLQLGEANARNQAFRDKMLTAVSDPERTVQQLRLQLDEFSSWLQWKAAALVIRDRFTKSDYHFPYPEACLEPAAALDRLEAFGEDENWEPGSLHTVHVADYPELLAAAKPPENLPVLAIFPFVREGEIQGGLLVFLEKNPGKETEADIRQVGQVFQSVVSFKRVQSELGLLNNRVRMLSAYLAEIGGQFNRDVLLEILFRFLSENFLKMNIAVLKPEAAEMVPAVKYGKLLDAQLIHRLLPVLEKRLEQGERFMYAASQAALREEFSVEPDNDRIHAVLFLPVLLDDAPMGHLVFECAEAQPFGPLELETLLLMIDLTTMMLGAQNQLERQELEQRRQLNKFREEIRSLTDKLAEKDLALQQQQALQEMTSFNSIFSLVQGAKVSLTNLRGFLRMTRDTNSSGKETANQEWVRNCLVEAERLESILQKFDLIQVITDQTYPLQFKEIQAGPYFEKILAALKSKSLSKKTSLEFNHDPNVNALKIDPGIMSQALEQFMLRLLDFLTGGKVLFDVQHKGGAIQILIRYTPVETLEQAVCDKLETLFRREFQFLLLQKVFARHEGRLDHTINPEKGVIVRGLIPIKT